MTAWFPMLASLAACSSGDCAYPEDAPDRLELGGRAWSLGLPRFNGWAYFTGLVVSDAWAFFENGTWHAAVDEVEPMQRDLRVIAGRSMNRTPVGDAEVVLELQLQGAGCGVVGVDDVGVDLREYEGPRR
jgi:hypothetical protein